MDIKFKNALNANVSPQPFAVSVSGIPDEFTVNVPHITVGFDPEEPLKIALVEFPSIRAHLPANFSVGLSVLGYELMCLHVCGEMQAITEPYRPNPCEVCGAAAAASPGPRQITAKATVPGTSHRKSEIREP